MHPNLLTTRPVTSTLIGCFRSNQPEDVCCSSLWRNRGEAISLLACPSISVHLSVYVSVVALVLCSVLPPAGGQWHCVEWDALVSSSPHGGRFSHRAGLQGGGRGAEGNTHGNSNKCTQINIQHVVWSVLLSVFVPEWLCSGASTRTPCWGIHRHVSTPTRLLLHDLIFH